MNFWLKIFNSRIFTPEFIFSRIFRPRIFSSLIFGFTIFFHVLAHIFFFLWRNFLEKISTFYVFSLRISSCKLSSKLKILNFTISVITILIYWTKFLASHVVTISTERARFSKNNLNVDKKFFARLKSFIVFGPEII